MKKIICAFCALLTVMLSTSVRASLDVSARAAFLMTAQGDVLYEKNADERLPMASTTKIMTCLIAAENCSASDVVTLTEESAGIEGSSLYLKAGDRVAAEDLIYAAMLRSANDAASALAIHIAGSEEAFADMMNEEAAKIGMENTHFTNPHGLPDDGHYTTARDLARLASCAMRNRTFAKAASAKEYVVTVNGNEKRPVKNHNKLLFSYGGACGVKTGYTKSSGRCLVSAAERDGVELICVTLDASDDWEDHRRLLDSGFEACCHDVIVGEGEIKKDLHVFGAGNVTAANAEDIEATFRKGAVISYVVTGERFPALPIEKGDVLGKLTAFADGKIVGECELISEEDIPLPPEKGFFEKIKELFGL